jgi:hypothetical protein
MNKREYSLTFISSFIFLTNAIHFYICNDFYYALLFFLLFITSFTYRIYQNNYLLILDKFAIFSIILYGCMIFYNKCKDDNSICIKKSLIITTFILTIYIYCYGYIHKKYCFSKNKNKGEVYYSLLHCISSIGHHLIMML